MTHLRRIFQILSLLFFVLLFILTIYPLASKSPVPVELYLRTDPLLALSTVIASRAWISSILMPLMIPATELYTSAIISYFILLVIVRLQNS